MQGGRSGLLISDMPVEKHLGYWVLRAGRDRLHLPHLAPTTEERLGRSSQGKGLPVPRLPPGVTGARETAEPR